jgi:effector-binding domain-containing protein
VFKIGEFSKLSQVPIKTLRYYDEIGLLRPAHVDEVTGYRFYSVDQLPRLNMVLALKDLGFKLDQVQDLVDNHVTVEQVQGMLRLRRAEIEGRLEEEEARLTRVEHRLILIDKERRMPQYEVVIKKAEPMQVAAVRGIVENYKSVGPLFDELFAAISKNQIAPIGPAVALYYDHEYKEKDVDVEVVIPISNGNADLSERVKVRELEGYEEIASLTRVGPYDDFTPAYQELMDWIQSNGYQIIGPNREIYLRGPEANIAPEEYVTEIQFPVTKA